MGLRRGAAREGDILFLCGGVGLARAGLLALEAMDAQSALKAWPRSCARHLRPFPLARAGAAVGEFAVLRGLGERIGLMDVSDGLARDLPRLLARESTGLGAQVTLTDDMLDGEVRSFARSRSEDPAMFAFLGGEDYALAGTCPAGDFKALAGFLAQRGYAPVRLGTVRAGAVALNGREVSGGFDHFS